MGILANPYQFAIIVPIEKMAEASALAVAMLGVDPSVAESTFSIPLGSGTTTTHRGGCGVISEEKVASIAGNVPAWAHYFRWGLEDGILLSTSENVQLGQQWSWADSLKTLNLSVVDL